MKKIIPILIPVIALALIFAYKLDTVESHKRDTLKYVLQTNQSQVNVFLDAVELLDSDDAFSFMKYRIERNDFEHGINSLLVDMNTKELISIRHEGELFCDPWTMPDDPAEFQSVLDNSDPEANFSLMCNGVECLWYYRDIHIDKHRYRVMVGIQPKAIDDALDYNKEYVPFGMMIVLVIYCLGYNFYSGRRVR